jgi:hypothetical protein
MMKAFLETLRRWIKEVVIKAIERALNADLDGDGEVG